MGENLENAIDEMNKNHTFIYCNGKSYIMNFRKNKEGITQISYSNRRDFETNYENRSYYYEGKKEPLGRIWIRHPRRNTKHYVDFLPGKQLDDDTVNLWQGFAVKPEAGSCELYLKHIHEVISSGDDEKYEYILNFMADMVQNPDKKPGVALVLKSDQGAGKGIFVENILKLFGSHGATVTSSGQIFGRFNGILSHKIPVFLDEALWSGDKQSEGNVKALITSPTVMIERKGIDPIEERNFIRLIIASNNDWVFPVGRKERRGCIIDVSGHRIGDHAYFKAIQHEMDNGGREALLQFLMERDLTGVDLRNYPRTEAFEEQMVQSFDGFEGWWYGCLENGTMFETKYDGSILNHEWTGPVDASALFNEFDMCVRQRGLKHHLSNAQFGKKLKKYVPDLQIRKMSSNSIRKNNYVFPSLEECRNNFDKIQGTTFKWSE